MTHRSLALLLGALALAGCKTEDPPTPWEIIRGTANLTANVAVDSATGNPLVTYTGRTGQLTIAADSSVDGWIKVPGGDSMHLTGTVTADGGQLRLQWTGASPTLYKVLTNSDFPSTYALLSVDVLHADLGGTPALESYMVYWEFDR